MGPEEFILAGAVAKLNRLELQRDVRDSRSFLPPDRIGACRCLARFAVFTVGGKMIRLFRAQDGIAEYLGGPLFQGHFD